MTNFSLVLLRYAWVALFIWFGTQQLLHPEAWVAFLPEWTGYFPVPGEMLVQLNGWLELILALALFLGLFTRLLAVLLSLHLLSIGFSVMGATGMRDVILGIMGLAIAFNEPDRWTLDAKLTRPAPQVL